MQVERTDLSKLKADVLNGVSMKYILLNNEINSCDIRTLPTLFTYLEPERNDKPIVYRYHGSIMLSVVSKYSYATWCLIHQL